MYIVQNFFDLIDGYKTYIGSAALFVAGGLVAVGVIDQKQFETAVVIIAAFTTYGLRQAIRKLE